MGIVDGKYVEETPPKTKGGKFYVELSENTGACLVIEAPTGVVYSTQTGGSCCDHPEVEGFIVPLLYFDWAELGKKTQDRREHVGPHFRPIPLGFDKTWLTDLLTEARVGYGHDVNIKLRENTDWMEAWIPIICDYGTGWLTWPNSD